jgi:tetratricopeptide (TPR) repeat protein
MASGAGADDYLPKPVFLNDVVALARLKAGESAAQSVFTSDTASLPICELLRALLAGMRSGHVELEDGSARLTFRQGQVVDAEVEGVRGARALSRMLLLAGGPYTVTFGPALARGTLGVDLRELCRSVLPDLIRSRRALERSLPLEVVLEIDTPRLREVLPDLSDGVNGLVRLFDGQRTLRQVILKSELPEASALLVTTRLYGLGALEPREPGAESLEQALALATRAAVEPSADVVPLTPAPLAPAPVEAFTRGRKLDDLDDRLAEALEHSAAAAARAARTPPPSRIVDVVYFTPPRSPVSPQAIQHALELAAERQAPPPARRPWWRGTQARVAAGALALFAASAALGSVLFRPIVPEKPAAASSGLPGLAALPDWLAPRAQGTAESWTALGLRRYDSGDLEGARAAAAQALALDARHGRALLLLATIHYGKGQQPEAKAALRRYLAVDPQGEFAAEARALLGR